MVIVNSFLEVLAQQIPPNPHWYYFLKRINFIFHMF